MEEKIIQWAEDRNLINGGTFGGQYQKLLEEVGELGNALIEHKELDIMDAIGDCVVVLTILARQNGMSLKGCTEYAYEQIKDRKGRMVNGVFVKE